MKMAENEIFNRSSDEVVPSNPWFTKVSVTDVKALNSGGQK